MLLRYITYTKGKSPYGCFVSICRPWGDFYHFYFYCGSRKHVRYGGQHAINFNYKNIIVLFTALAGALWSKVSFCYGNLTVTISMYL